MTGTGTLLLTLLDVNDHAPELDREAITVCNSEPETQHLRILDKDQPPNTFPFRAELTNNSHENWAVEMDARGECCLEGAFCGTCHAKRGSSLPATQLPFCRWAGPCPPPSPGHRLPS